MRTLAGNSNQRKTEIPAQMLCPGMQALQKQCESYSKRFLHGLAHVIHCFAPITLFHLIFIDLQSVLIKVLTSFLKNNSDTFFSFQISVFKIEYGIFNIES